MAGTTIWQLDLQKGLDARYILKVYFEDIFDKAGSEYGPLEAR